MLKGVLLDVEDGEFVAVYSALGAIYVARMNKISVKEITAEY